MAGSRDASSPRSTSSCALCTSMNTHLPAPALTFPSTHTVQQASQSGDKATLERNGITVSRNIMHQHEHALARACTHIIQQQCAAGLAVSRQEHMGSQIPMIVM